MLWVNKVLQIIKVIIVVFALNQKIKMISLIPMIKYYSHGKESFEWKLWIKLYDIIIWELDYINI